MSLRDRLLHGDVGGVGGLAARVGEAPGVRCQLQDSKRSGQARQGVEALHARGQRALRDKGGRLQSTQERRGEKRCERMIPRALKWTGALVAALD